MRKMIKNFTEENRDRERERFTCHRGLMLYQKHLAS